MIKYPLFLNTFKYLFKQINYQICISLLFKLIQEFKLNKFQQHLRQNVR